MKPIWMPAALLSAASIVVLGFWLWPPDKFQADLERKYLAAPGDMRDVAGLQLHVRDTGSKSAPALVLLRGFTS